MSTQHTGKRLGSRYVLRRVLGEGGICTVYEAHHIYSGRRVAVKILNDDYAQHEEARARLLDEARALGMVHHPHIVEIHDAGFSGTTPYVVMELLEGRTLEGLIASRGRLPFADTAQVGRQVALGLLCAHRAGLVHRDLKPSNVLIVRTPVGKEIAQIIDFGVARLPVIPNGPPPKASPDTIVGTPEYMPPEQLQGRHDLDARADIYALGVVMFEALTETVPYPGDFQEVLAKVALGERPTIRSLRPEMPAPLADVIERCLARNPAERYPDAYAVIAALDATGLTRQNLHLLDAPHRDATNAELAQSRVSAVAPARRDTRDSMELPGGRHSAVPGILPTDRISAVRLPGERGSAPADPAAIKRNHQRAHYNGPVRVITAASAVDMRAEDISEGGLLVIGPRGLSVGERIQLKFAQPTSGELTTTEAIVRWIRDRSGNPRAPCAFGFQFVDPPAALRASIGSYLAYMGRA